MNLIFRNSEGCCTSDRSRSGSRSGPVERTASAASFIENEEVRPSFRFSEDRPVLQSLPAIQVVTLQGGFKKSNFSNWPIY